MPSIGPGKQSSPTERYLAVCGTEGDSRSSLGFSVFGWFLGLRWVSHFSVEWEESLS